MTKSPLGVHRLRRLEPGAPPVPGTSLDPLHIRKVLGKGLWSAPHRYGPDGWYFNRAGGTGRVIVSCDDYDGIAWIHASISYSTFLPKYEDLKMLHQAVFGKGWAYQVFAPPSDHINIHEFVLHLFGRLDGGAALPDFTRGTGSI